MANGRELAEQQQHVRDIFKRIDRVGVLLTRQSRSGLRRFYRVIVCDPEIGIYTPTGAIASALGLRVVDGIGGKMEIALDGGAFDGQHEIAQALFRVLGREIALDRL